MRYQIPSLSGKKYRNRSAFCATVGLFDVQVAVFFDVDDVYNFYKCEHGIKMEKNFLSRGARGQAGVVFDDDGLPYFFLHYATENPAIGTVAHEVAHIALDICAYVGVKVTKKHDETFARIVDTLVQQVVDGIQERHTA